MKDVARWSFLLLLAACQGTPVTEPGDLVGDERALDRGTVVELALPSTARTEAEQLGREFESFQDLETDALLAKHPIAFTPTLGYDPLQAVNLGLIQQSGLRLNAAELAKLASQGFVITPRNSFAHMLDAYTSIYASDLPVYVSLDSILDAVHRSYDRILTSLEEKQLSRELRSVLSGARKRLGRLRLERETVADVDLFLTVAQSLLDGERRPSQFSENDGKVAKLLRLFQGDQGLIELELFGTVRDYDASQFKPRGHYTQSEALTRYFRAMIWLGRTDFRLIETQRDGGTLFRRRQLEATLAMSSLIQDEAREAYDRLDQAITAFVGEHDYMQLNAADQLLADVGGYEGLEEWDDAELAQLILDKGYGAQRVASQVIFKDTSDPNPLPLGRSFALLGQRYVVDAHVMSNVVFDRVPVRAGAEVRGMPSALDVAYAAFDNPAALPLLKEQLVRHKYAAELEQSHHLVQAHEAAYWNENLYNLWISALRAVSPAAGDQDPAAAGMPAVTGSEAWSRRMLNTQLASWSQLRRDTVLYVKQSYSTGAACEFPDGYVDPYPEAFARLEAFAMKGEAVAALFDGESQAPVSAYFQSLAQISGLLRSMAERQRSGMPFDQAQLDFLNDAVRSHVEGCAGPTTFTGWYRRLIFGDTDKLDPTIADVHTNPGQNAPPTVLHVATGKPRMMVMTRESCSGPRAYAGPVFSFYEFEREFPRLSDEEWKGLAHAAEDVPFMRPILPPADPAMGR
ncbi:MAG TPA: DUF3160 domain-containing protein [Polyangiales bacterium]